MPYFLNPRAIALLREKLSPDDFAAFQELTRIASDETPVGALPAWKKISPRTRTFIMRNLRIFNTGALANKTVRQLLSLHGFGEEMLREVKQLLASGGRNLKDSAPVHDPELVPAEDEDSIDVLELSERAQEGLRYCGIRTIGELVRFDQRKLRSQTPYFGKVSYDEVVAALARVGRHLGDRD